MADEIIYFCATQTPLNLAELQAWGKRELAWTILGDLPSVTPAQFRDTVTGALAEWAAATPLSFRWVAPGQHADVQIITGRIDGPAGVLAWSELPNGSDQTLTQKYDFERFVVGTPGAGQIGLFEVVLHEFGHALGLEHAAQGTEDVMAPIYRAGLRKLQPMDIKRVQALYGKPLPPPPPPPPPTPGGSMINIYIRNATSTQVSVTGKETVVSVKDAAEMSIPGWHMVKE